MKVKYVRFDYPGTFVDESSMTKRTTDDPEQIEVPKGAFAFRFCERTEVEADGETLLGEWQYDDRTFYAPGSRIVTLAEVKAGAIEGDCNILISNMECNGWDRIVQTNRGNCKPYQENDYVLS